MNYSSLYQGKSAVRVALVGCLLLTSAAMANPSSPDLDRDRIPNIADPDVDNDGIPNGRDRNIDGGTARSGSLRGKYIGDRLPNSHSAELDMDADGLPDNHPSETDIDGDGLLDSDQMRELDIDGDGIANGLDAEADGDAIVNAQDRDMYGDGEINDIFTLPGSEEAYALDDTVLPIINFVSGEVRRMFQISATDTGLRVRVNPKQFGNLVTGVWRYLSADNIEVWAKWAYSVDNPNDLMVSVDYEYNGPLSGNPEDYINPSFYSISEESRVCAGYPRGPGTFVSWLPGEPLGFYYTAPGQEATGIEPPVAGLTAALRSYANFWNEGTAFSGDIAPTFTGILPIIQLERTLLRVTRAANGVFEARELARSMR